MKHLGIYSMLEHKTPNKTIHRDEMVDQIRYIICVIDAMSEFDILYF